MARKPVAKPLPDDVWWDFAVLRRPEVSLHAFDRHPLMLAICVAYLALGLLARYLGFSPAPVGWLLVFLIGSTLLKLTWIDLRLQLLPNILVGWLLVLAVALLIGEPHTTFQRGNLLIGFIAGGAFFGLLGWGFERLCGRAGLGMGDVKLLAVLGLLVGATGLPLLLLLASWGSLPIILYQRSRRPKKIGADQHFAFGPMLCAAGWVVLLFQSWLWQTLGTLTGHPMP